MVAGSHETHDGQHPRQKTAKTKSSQDKGQPRPRTHAPTSDPRPRGAASPPCASVRNALGAWGGHTGVGPRSRA